MDEENELGMNLFLGDDYFDDDENLDQDPPVNESLDLEDVQDEDKEIKEETDEDENLEDVDGDTEDEDTDDKTDVNSSPPIYKSFASVLVEEGVLTSVDSSKLENVKTIQDVADLISEEIKSKELKDLTILQREAVEAFRSGVDVETFQRQKQTENQLDSITEDILIENEDLRKQLIFQDFVNQGFSEQKATRLTTRSFEADDDIEDAKEALENMKVGVKERFNEQVEFEKNQRIQQSKQKEEQQELIKKTILETEEPLKGIKLNQVARKQVLDTMMNPVSKNPSTNIEENALMKDQRENKDFAQRLYTVYSLSKGFTDFSYFGKKERSKTINELEKALKNNQHITTGGDPSFLDDANSSDFEIGDKLVF